MLSEFFQSVIVISVLAAMIRISTPLLLAALGEMVSQRAGILNLGVEGTMLMGAFAGFLAAEQTGNLWLGALTAIIAGGLMSLIMVFMASTLKVNQTVTGLSLNLLASGMTLYSYRVVYAEFDPSQVPIISLFDEVSIPLLSEIPFLGEILFSQRVLTYIALLMVPVIWFFLFRTRYGLVVRSLGENPRAADLRGINIVRYQYPAVIFGGMMAGLGGSFLTLGSSVKFVPEISAGRGWLALVIVIAGNWRPTRILIAALLFALLDAIQLQVQGVGVQIPYQILLALPYVFAIVAMIGSRSLSLKPGALGVPYQRE